MPNTKQPPGVEFIRQLRQAGVEADDRLLAEMIWLSRLMTAEQEPGAFVAGVARTIR